MAEIDVYHLSEEQIRGAEKCASDKGHSHVYWSRGDRGRLVGWREGKGSLPSTAKTVAQFFASVREEIGRRSCKV